MNKLIVILGPTATGKTSLATKLAYSINGAIISADSRQIYKNMDIGTGKDLSEYNVEGKKIPYHLIDIINPNKNYSVYQFQEDFNNAYNKIIKSKKYPVLCGGTGLYIESVLLNYNIPSVSPDYKLRKKLDKYDLKQLIEMLFNLDKTAYKADFHITKRRVIRTIEVCKSSYANNKKNDKTAFDSTLIIGLNLQRETILKKIKIRLEERLNEGMIEEVESLLDNGLSLERLKYFGLEYKFIGQYLEKKLTYEEMKNKLNIAINRFSKRQMTFFRRMEKRQIKINWQSHNNISKTLELYRNYFNGL